MIFVDDFKSAINLILHPSKGTAKTMNIGQSLAFFYKVSVIPAIIFILLGIFATSYVSSFLGMLPAPFSSIGAGAGIAILVILGLIFIWVVVPISLFVDAAILHLFGKFLLRQFKGDYSNTFAGYVYGEMPVISLFWLVFILAIASPLLGILVFFLLALWSLVVGIIAIANQNKTSRLSVIGVIIVEIVVIFIIEFVAFALLGIGTGL